MDEYFDIYYKIDFSIIFEGVAVDGVFNDNIFEKFKCCRYPQLTDNYMHKLAFNKLEVRCSSKTSNHSLVVTDVSGTLVIHAQHKKNAVSNYQIIDCSHYFIESEVITLLRKLFVLFSCNEGEPSYIQEKKVLFKEPEVISCTGGVDKSLVKIHSDTLETAYLAWKNKTGDFTEMNSYAEKLLIPLSDSIAAAIFWIDAANSNSLGSPESSFVKKFMYTWMAFNSLYGQYSGSEQNQIGDYIDSNPVLKGYINNLFCKKREQIKAFVTAQVKLNNKDIYQHLNTYMNGLLPAADYKCLETTLLLCIYAVRCRIFHGGFDSNYLNLLRLCIELLDPIVKKGIIISL